MLAIEPHYWAPRLRLLQSTIVGEYFDYKFARTTRLTRGAGVVILHLLLIPGTAFLAGGAQVWEQNLHPHPTELNHSLLAVGYVLPRNARVSAHV